MPGTRLLRGAKVSDDGLGRRPCRTEGIRGKKQMRLCLASRPHFAEKPPTLPSHHHLGVSYIIFIHIYTVAHSASQRIGQLDDFRIGQLSNFLKVQRAPPWAISCPVQVTVLFPRQRILLVIQAAAVITNEADKSVCLRLPPVLYSRRSPVLELNASALAWGDFAHVKHTDGKIEG